MRRNPRNRRSDEIKIFEEDRSIDERKVAPKKAVKAPVKKAILAALGETDPQAEICTDAKGNPEPDSNLRDTEIVPLPDNIPLPLPLEY